MLSQGVREVLIKAVLQAMPTYTMGCFLLPKSLCKDIESLIANSGGGTRGKQGKFIGLDGTNFASQNAKED